MRAAAAGKGARRAAVTAALLGLWCAWRVGPAVAAEATWDLNGHFADGALWRARVPRHWNGVLLLYSHGYSPRVQPPQLAPAGLEPWLLEKGYALAASSYAQGGWAVAEAVPDQQLTLKTFTEQVARPAQTLTWGDSMGGLITAALTEDPKPAIQGGISACGSLGGSLTMMNMALDGAFAFVTLQAPDAGIRLVGVEDDRANGARVSKALEQAMATPAGRARVALAGVLAGLPTWTGGATPPTADDYTAQLNQMEQTLPAAVFPPRSDQEHRAQGVNSWNEGVDYRKLLAATGRRRWVNHYYALAHLSLERDLQTLNAAPRIHADAAAVRYMRAHYEPRGTPQVPLLSLHTLGDGITSPALQSAFARRVGAGAMRNYRPTWVRAAGHCAFSGAEYVAALDTLQTRIRTGRWAVSPSALNAAAAKTGLGPGRFVRAHISFPGRP